MVADDDFDDLLAVGNEEQGKEDRLNRKRERKAFLRNVIILLLILAVLVGTYFAFTSYQKYADNQSRLKAEAAREEIMLEPLHTEQVEWADLTCSKINSWKQKDFPVYNKQADPVKVRNDMVKSLRDNAVMMRAGAEGISLVPYEAHEKALEESKNVTLVDTIVSIHPEGRDDKTTKASQALSTSLQLYAQSLDDMAADLETIADYDKGGMRSAIIRVSTMLPKINKDMEGNLNKYFTENIFANNVTKREVATLESCNDKMFPADHIDKTYGEDLKEQDILKSIIVIDRCKDFLDNTAEFATPYEVVEKNINVCKEYITKNAVDPNNPISDKVIKTLDVEMAYPNMNTDGEGSPDTTGTPTPTPTPAPSEGSRPWDQL